MPTDRPHVIVLGGPNGAGKSTAAPYLLKDTLAVTEFVNADTVAEGLSAFEPAGAAIQAGRIVLARLRELAAARANFAFEITLASRSFAGWIAGLRRAGYAFHLYYLWLPTAELAVARVAERVRVGGHHVPEETIRRRYRAGLKNVFRLYCPLADAWRLYDNSLWAEPRLMAAGLGEQTETITDPVAWRRITREAEHG
jgi:predicted ABC-type ATPase